MSLLFRKRASRVGIFQTGGSVPYYSQYQVKLASQPEFNPSALLQKYGTPAAEEKKSQSSTPKSETFGDLKEFPALDIDRKRVLNRLHELESEIDQMVNVSKLPLEHPLVSAKMRELRYQTVEGMGLASNQKKIWDAARESMSADKNASATSPVFSEGRFLAKKIVKDKKGNNAVEKIDWIDPETMNNSTDALYQPLTNSEALEYRNSLPDANFEFNDNIINAVNNSMGVNKVFNQVIAPFYDKLGITKRGTRIENEEGTFSMDASTMVQMVDDWSDENNQAQAEDALSQVKASIRNMPGFDSLMATAWTSMAPFKNEKGEVEERLPKSREEAEANLNLLLLKDMTKKVRSVTKNLDRDKNVIKPPPKAAGSGDRAPAFAELSLAHAEMLDTPDRTFTREYKAPDGKKINARVIGAGKDSKVNSQALSEVVKNNVAEDEKGNKITLPVLLNDLNLGYTIDQTNVGEAILENGKKLKELPGLKARMVVDNQSVGIVDVAVDGKGNPVYFNPEDLKVFNESIANIKKKYQNNQTTVGIAQMYEEMDQAAKQFKGAKTKTFYILKATASNQPEVESGEFVSSGLADIAIPQLVDINGKQLPDANAKNTKYRMALDKGLTEEGRKGLGLDLENNLGGLEGYFGSFGGDLYAYNVLVPAPDLYYLQAHGAKIETERENINVTNLMQEQQKKNAMNANVRIFNPDGSSSNNFNFDKFK
jgi:hypothetical protein